MFKSYEMMPRPVVSLTVIGTVIRAPGEAVIIGNATVTGGVPVAVGVADIATVGVNVAVEVAVGASVDVMLGVGVLVFVFVGVGVMQPPPTI